MVMSTCRVISWVVAKGPAQLNEVMNHAMQGRQRWWVIVKSSEKTWSSEGGNGSPLHYSCHENLMNNMKRQNYIILEDEPPRFESVQHASGEECRAITNSSRKNEVAGPKQKWWSAVDGSDGENKVWYWKEQYCIQTWNVRSMNQGNLDVLKQETARGNMDMLEIHELKWMGMGEFNSEDHYIYCCGQESLPRNGVAIIVNKRLWNTVIGCILKNDRMISVRFQGKPLASQKSKSMTQPPDVEEAEADRSYEDLQDLLEVTPKEDVLFFIGDWNAKVGSQETLRIISKFGLGVQNEAG